MKQLTIGAGVLCILVNTAVFAEYYSYMNEASEYVITRERPKNLTVEYAVLTDGGEFIRSVQPKTVTKRQNIPIDHWRPWFMPREPHHLVAQIPDTEPVPTVTVGTGSVSGI